MKIVTSIVIAMLLRVPGIRAAEYYVAQGGKDSNSGTIEQPLATLQKALDTAQPGDTVILRAGVYSAPAKLKGKKGAPGKPITVTTCPGEKVRFERARPVKTRWTRFHGNIYKSDPLPFDTWQLFIGDRMVQLARWPNASLEDERIWDMAASMRATDRGYDYRKKQYTGQTRPGVICDRNWPTGGKKEIADEGASSTRVSGESNQETLAETGIDFTGAVAMLNIGHWLTWARPVLEHQAGTDLFTFDPAGTKMMKTCNYYLLGLQCLDRENEWWFDRRTRIVYLYAPGGADPNGLEVRARTGDYCIELDGCESIEFRGIDFFSGGIWAGNCSNLVFEDCSFLFPSENKVVLGVYDWYAPFRHGKELNSMFSFYGGKKNVLRNCEVAYANSPIFLGSDGMVVENCRFHHIEWDLLSNGASGSVMLGRAGVARRNTIHTGGNSEGLRPFRDGTTLELNHLWNLGLLQHDGAAINVGNKAQAGCVVRYNWVHDSNRQGIRFDYGGPDAPPDNPAPPPEVSNGLYAYNVIWNSRSNQVKGNRHLVHNNTVFHSFRFGVNHQNPLCDISISGFRYMHKMAFNEETITRNNIAALACRSWAVNRPESRRLPGIHDHNLNEPDAAFRYLRDPANLDFRPRKGSAAVDAGAVITASEVPGKKVRFSPMQYLGKGPDIGAYEFGDARYWIPGAKLPAPSTPVPPDKATAVKTDADLIFLEAYHSVRHEVFFGSEPDGVEHKSTLSETNIFDPGPLKPGHTYYWRVDAVDMSGRTIPGATWSFKTGQERP